MEVEETAQDDEFVDAKDTDEFEDSKDDGDINTEESLEVELSAQSSGGSDSIRETVDESLEEVVMDEGEVDTVIDVEGDITEDTKEEVVDFEATMDREEEEEKDGIDEVKDEDGALNESEDYADSQEVEPVGEDRSEDRADDGEMSSDPLFDDDDDDGREVLNPDATDNSTEEPSQEVKPLDNAPVEEKTQELGTLCEVPEIDVEKLSDCEKEQSLNEEDDGQAASRLKASEHASNTSSTTPLKVKGAGKRKSKPVKSVKKSVPLVSITPPSNLSESENECDSTPNTTATPAPPDGLDKETSKADIKDETESANILLKSIDTTKLIGECFVNLGKRIVLNGDSMLRLPSPARGNAAQGSPRMPSRAAALSLVSTPSKLAQMQESPRPKTPLQSDSIPVTKSCSSDLDSKVDVQRVRSSPRHSKSPVKTSKTLTSNPAVSSSSVPSEDFDECQSPQNDSVSRQIESSWAAKTPDKTSKNTISSSQTAQKNQSQAQRK